MARNVKRQSPNEYSNDSSQSVAKETDTSRVKENISEGVGRLSDRFIESRDRLVERAKNFSETVKTQASKVSQDVKVRADEVSQNIKSGAQSMDTQVRANPYAFAAGAAVCGFILGRLIMSRTEGRSFFGAYQKGDIDHTGVHVR